MYEGFKVFALIGTGNTYMFDVSDLVGIMMPINTLEDRIMTIFEKLKPIISDQLGVKMEIVTMDASFKDDLEADSLDMVNLTSEIEDEFAIEISDKVTASLQTVGDVVRFIENR
jgi:acyl carrier protein